MRKRILLLPVLVAALLTISASAAQAGAFVLTLEDLTGGTSTVITDQFAPDVNATLDRILFMGKVGTFDVTIFANTYLPGPSGAPVQMNVSNFRVTSTGAGDFRATLTRTDLYSPLLGSAVVGIRDRRGDADRSRQRGVPKLGRGHVGVQSGGQYDYRRHARGGLESGPPERELRSPHGHRLQL